LVVILILFIPLRLFCEKKKWIACSEENGDCTNPDRYNNIYQQLILEILLQVIVCITIVVAIIPEALPLAFGVTINTYMKQTIMSTKYVNKRASQFNSSPLGQTACESDDQEKLIF
jgi:magnesium-transporting ATPase (P-type)